ncbi:Protein wings apart-like [Armadillidium vulgare]|nr:Protein wings apart-like [Armadillidium vulgare]
MTLFRVLFNIKNFIVNMVSEKKFDITEKVNINQEILFRAREDTGKRNWSDTTTATGGDPVSVDSSTKDSVSSGIPPKRRKNSDVNSCETYSSTVQLPSDDSGSSSSSSSVANSPRPETAGKLEINQAQSPNGLVLDSCPSSGFVSDEINSSKNLIPDSISNNSTSFNPNCIVNENFNSSLSYSSDLLSEDVDKKISDDSPICTESITESYSSINIKDNSILGNENDSLDINESVTRVEESDRLRTSISKKDSEEEVVVNKREQSPSSQDSQEVDLFSTDFDENEIIDRTSIEYPSNSSTFRFSDQSLSRSNTIDLDDVESLQSSSLMSYNPNSITKSQSLQENESSKSLVLTKKRSIFKSRQKEDSKKRATYKHKWHGNEDKEESFKKENVPKSASTVSHVNDDPFSFDTTPVLKRVQTWPSNSQAINDSFEEEPQAVTQVKCPRQAKKQLAECAAMVMFALSQDRLNMDLDRGSLELMLNLLDTDGCVTESGDQLSEAAALDQKSKIRSLCKELQQKGHAKHLKLDNIKAATLAMETLLSLTSKRAGEWFKEELRELGGVDHLMRTITSCMKHFQSDIQSWSPSLMDKLSKVDRCLKVLENVTHQNESNQEYILNYNTGEFSNTLMGLYRMCQTEVPLNPLHPQGYLALCDPNILAAKGIVTTLMTTLKVLINLTHGSRKEGSKILGKDDEIYNISIYCLLIMPMYLDHDRKFEIQVLACCLLLNLLENSPQNRQRLMNLKSPIAAVDDEDEDEIFGNRERESAMSSLITLFYTSEESARIQEADTNQIIDKDLVQETTKEDEEIEETVARLLQKAGRHMEDTLIAAYTALLAGYCLMDNKEFEDSIRLLQPEGHFKTMVAVLKKFLHFMNLTATTSLLRSLKPTERVVKYMDNLDRSPEEEAEEKLKKEKEAEAIAYEAFGLRSFIVLWQDIKFIN